MRAGPVLGEDIAPSLREAGHRERADGFQTGVGLQRRRSASPESRLGQLPTDVAGGHAANVAAFLEELSEAARPRVGGASAHQRQSSSVSSMSANEVPIPPHQLPQSQYLTAHVNVRTPPPSSSLPATTSDQRRPAPGQWYRDRRTSVMTRAPSFSEARRMGIDPLPAANVRGRGRESVVDEEDGGESGARSSSLRMRPSNASGADVEERQSAIAGQDITTPDAASVRSDTLA